MTLDLFPQGSQMREPKESCRLQLSPTIHTRLDQLVTIHTRLDQLVTIHTRLDQLVANSLWEKNVLVAYMPWECYNSEDAVLISESRHGDGISRKNRRWKMNVSMEKGFQGRTEDGK
ncbi:hypothetical protein ACFX13_006357 [Malus domestica]